MRESPPSSRRMYGMISSSFGSYLLRSVRRTRAPLPEERRAKMVICPCMFVKAKAKTRLCNTVSDWKDKWEIYGYEGKPTELTKDVWDDLIAF
ncbi:hypothetical protein F2Q69_00009914 [Brassica cretica]|uniref:Uncharacterized protein n=1 Tax=Brassica cretica TaxID=69181 RepID=A0A8S9P4V9_BRACR|nr:hypothetical protein F2Q69_00009914 [Brassica cretica]